VAESFFVPLQYKFATGQKSADRHGNGRARQMKIGQQNIAPHENRTEGSE